MNNQEATFFRPHVISPSAATCPVSPSPVTQSCILACVTTLLLLQTGTLRYRQVTGVVLSPRKPGRPFQRATGIFVKTSLAHHALAWSNNGPVDGAHTACTVPHFTEGRVGLQRGRATCLRSHSQEGTELSWTQRGGEPETPRVERPCPRSRGPC